MGYSNCLLACMIIFVSIVEGTSNNTLKAVERNDSFASQLQQFVPNLILEPADGQLSTGSSELITEISHLYHEEYAQQHYQVKFVERTLDTRLANVYAAELAIQVFNVAFHEFNNPNLGKEYESYTHGPEVDEELCAQHLQYMNSLFDELYQYNRNIEQQADGPRNSTLDKLDERHILLARILDSYGRYESGSFSGRRMAIGSTEQCLETQLKLGNTPSNQQMIGTRACFAFMKQDNYIEPMLRNGNLRQSAIEVGICLPNTCHSHSLNDKTNRKIIQKLISSQFQLPEPIYAHKHREVYDLFCINDGNETVSLPIAGRLFVLAAILWFAFLVIATYKAESWKRSESKMLRTFGHCMDLKSLALDFIDSAKDFSHAQGSRVNVAPVDLVKFFGMVLVVLGHAFGFHMFFADDSLRTSGAFRRRPELTGFTSINLVVDIFFVISGLLLTYSSLKKLKSKLESSSTLSQLSLVTLHLVAPRYLRLLPIYFIIHRFKQSVLIHLSRGPLWDTTFNIDTLDGACRQESWLIPFTGYTSYVGWKQCLPHAWSIGCEILFLIFMAPLIIVMGKKPKLAVFMAIVLGITSVVVQYRTIMGTDPEDLVAIEKYRANSLRLLFVKYNSNYMNAHLRVVPALLGLICGYVIYAYENNHIKTLPKRFIYWATKFSISFVIMTIIGFHLQPYSMKTVEESGLGQTMVLSLAILRVPWAIAISILIFRLVTDWRNSSIVRFLTGRAFRVLTKLNLLILLIHVDLLSISLYHGSPTMTNFSTPMFIEKGVATYVYSVIIAAILYVCVESPIKRLVQKVILKEKFKEEESGANKAKMLEKKKTT